MDSLMFVDLCNVKAQGRIHGSIDWAIDIVMQKVGPFVESGFEVEIVIDSSRESQGSSFQKEVVAHNIVCIFTCIEESGMQLTADDYILSKVSENLNKKRKHDRVILITDDSGFRETAFYLVGPKPNFSFEIWGVSEFLNNKNGLV